MSIINDIHYFSTLFDEKEQQFVLLNMEIFKEEDIEYLRTFKKEELIKIRDNIKNICDNIYEIDTKLIDICKNIKEKVGDENYVKFNLKLNYFLNVSLSMLMNSPRSSIQVYKFWDDKKTSVNTDYYNLQMSPKSPSPKAVLPPQKALPLKVSPSQIPQPISQPQKALPLKVSPSQIPQPISQPRSPKAVLPPNAVLPSKKRLSRSQNTDPKSDKFSCYIDILLVKENDYPFLNAIFNYGIYKTQLHIIYKRLFNLHAYIYNIKQYIEIFKKVDTIYDSNLITNIMKQMLFLIDGNDIDINSYYTQMHNYKKSTFPKNSNNKCLYTIITQNDEYNNYNVQVNNFIYYMRYIQEIYIYTLGKVDFINAISHYFSTNDDEKFENEGWNVNIIKYLEGQNSEKYDFQSIYSLFDKYLEIADTQKIINIKIIEKIFSINFLPDIEPFKIIYNKIDFSYEDLANNYNITIPDSKNYIQIMQDNNNKYFNIFNTGVLEV